MDLETITLHRMNPPVTLDTVRQRVHMPECDLSVNEYVTFRDRTDGLLRRYNLIPKAKATGPRSLGSHPFLLNNTQEITHRKRGHIKRAPWFLRPFFDAVVTKERY